MKNSAFISIAAFCLLATSCASSIRNGCGQAEAILLTRADIPPVIAATDSLQTFDMEISFLGKHLNGMMLVKQQDSATVRMLINSHFGMSMADFEISPDTFAVHYLFDAMNKPVMADLFKNDFELLFGFHLPERFVARTSSCRHAGGLLYVDSPGEKKYWYRMNGVGQNIDRIKAPGVNVEISGNASPRTVILKHRGIFGPTIVIKEIERSFSE